MKSKHICPKCGGKAFETPAHVVQMWKVDENGNFLDVVAGCTETTHEPDDDNIWVCCACGAEGVVVEE